MSQRLHELDSLRGLAACTVVLCHFWDGLGADAYLAVWHSPLRIFVAGHDAVILFFVLSGFVLTLPYERNGKLSYWSFIAKRVCRIYLPYLGALAVAVAMNFHYHGLITNDAWINQTWDQKPHAHVLLQHIVFLGDYPWTRFNTAFWSLVYEMRISLIFPFLAIAVLRLRNAWMFALAIFSSLLSDHYSGVFELLHLNPPSPQLGDTLHYMSFFILGAILAKNREFIRKIYGGLPGVAVIFLFALATALYCHPFDVPASAGRIVAAHKVTDWSVAFGSLIIMSLALYCRPFQKFLNHSVINYLGRISYSVYLVHGTVVFTMIYLLQGHLSLKYLPVYLAAVLGLASIFYYLIEVPSIALGRKLGKVVG